MNPSKSNQTQVQYTTAFCYCQSELDEYEDPDDGDWCHHCYGRITKDEDFYGCSEEQCIYETITNMQYFVCNKCYHKNTYHQHNKQESSAFVHQICVSSMNAIS